jgi:hypothetical protein
MLNFNDGANTSQKKKEFLSESFLNFCLIVVNIAIPLVAVVAEQIYRSRKEATDEANMGEEVANPVMELEFDDGRDET